MVVFILNTASPWIIPKRSTAPQHTRFILPPIHPTKSSLRCMSGIFLLRETYLENFMSRPDVIPTFRQRRCTNRGRNFVRSKRRPPYISSTTSTCFCALTIRKHLLKMRFERSGRGQEPSRGHKFSILENFLSIRDFTSTMRPHFRSDLVGACLPQTLPDKSKEALSAPVLFLSLLRKKCVAFLSCFYYIKHIPVHYIYLNWFSK